jgi:hypothetical protein
MSTCIATTVSGSRCKNGRGLVNELCAKHRNYSSSPSVSCEALLVKGARKGQTCGATASTATKLCKRHVKSKIVVKKPAKTTSYIGMLFVNSDEKHNVSVFGPFDSVDSCKDVAMETLSEFSGDIVAVEDYNTVENCVLCWTIGENVQVCVVKIEPKNPMKPISTPPTAEEVKEELRETPLPTTPRANSNCSFIITRGVNKGNACGKTATSGPFCSKHKSKIGFLTEVEQIITDNSPQKSKFPSSSAPTPNEVPALEDVLYDLPVDEELPASPTLSITSDTTASSSNSDRYPIPDEDDYIIAHKKTKLTIYADVNCDDCKDLDIQLDSETSLTKKGSKYILRREDRTFTGRSVYEASKYIIENLESDIRLDTITFNGQTIHLNTLDN